MDCTELRHAEKLTPKEVAEILNREEDTIYKWLRSGRLRGRFVMGRWLILKRDVDKLIMMSNP